MNVSFTRRSGNRKTGPIPVTSQESSTCADSCPHKKKGCYPEYSYTGIHWRRLDAGQVGINWDQLMTEISRLPLSTTWRYGVAGDLPGKGNRINRHMLNQMVEANRGKEVICYSHKPLTKANRDMIHQANQNGFTINLSADSVKDADRKMALGIGPVAMTLPEDPAQWPKFTADGHRIVPCPAVTHDKVTCASCKLCAKRDRKVIIGFPAHGSGKKYVEQVFWADN